MSDKHLDIGRTSPWLQALWLLAAIGLATLAWSAGGTVRLISHAAFAALMLAVSLQATRELLHLPRSGRRRGAALVMLVVGVLSTCYALWHML